MVIVLIFPALLPGNMEFGNGVTGFMLPVDRLFDPALP